MLCNVFRSRVSRWIACDHLLAFALVDTDIVNPHDCRKAELVELDVGPRRTDTQIQNDAHGFLCNRAGLHVAVGTKSSAIEFALDVVADEESDVRILVSTWFIVVRVALVGCTIEPFVVQHGRHRNCLLKGATGIGVDE